MPQTTNKINDLAPEYDEFLAHLVERVTTGDSQCLAAKVNHALGAMAEGAVKLRAV